MFTCRKLKKLYPLLALAFLFFMCAGTGADYSDWYNENPEEDLLGSMFGQDATQEGSQSTDTNAQFIPNEGSSDFNDESVQDNGYTSNSDRTTFTQDDQAVDNTPASPGAKRPKQNAQATSEYKLNGHIAEYRSEIIRESKMASQNKIELIISNKIRIKTISDSRWRSFGGAYVTAEDNQDLTITYSSQRTDPNGSFRVTLQPADPYKFFSFVPFEETGFEPSNYSVPISAIDLNTVTFHLQTEEGAWHSYQYSYQTYDLRSTIDSFVNWEINANSKPVTIRVYGAESRYPIQDAKVTIKGTPPSRLRLLSKYFKNLDLLNYALKVAPNYADNQATIYSSLGGTKFNLYYPFEYDIEISHPDYFYKTTHLNVDRNTEVVDVFLERLFTNARIVQQSSLD